MITRNQIITAGRLNDTDIPHFEELLNRVIETATSETCLATTVFHWDNPSHAINLPGIERIINMRERIVVHILPNEEKRHAMVSLFDAIPVNL